MLHLRPHLRAMLLVTLLLACAVAQAGLRDIHPRPHQMGQISPLPATFTGTLLLVMPDFPTADEQRVRDEALRQIVMKIGTLPEVVSWADYHGQTPALWLGTLDRFPALAAALDSTGIAGLGATTHAEEYQLVVQEQRVLLGGSDTRGLRWGVQSLIFLMAAMMDRITIDRAYIRDWPDFHERVGTINSYLNTDDQLAYLHRVADAGYAARMNEMEWNSGLATGSIRPFAVPRINAVLAKLRNFGMILSAGADNTAKAVGEYFWREGVPVRDMPLLVTDTTMISLPTGYPVVVQNGALESWSGGRPNNFTMYSNTYFTWVAQDTTIRHGGTSSAKISATTAGPSALDLRQLVVVGKERMLRYRMWYRVAGFKGQLRLRLMGTKTPINRYEDRYVTFSNTTTQDWTPLDFDFRSFDADTVLMMVGTHTGTGTVWLDDVQISIGKVQDIVRRVDTPVELYRQRQNLLMAEGVDYRIVEGDTAQLTQYVRKPRIERIPGGRLAVGDTVLLDWYCGGTVLESTGGKQTPCFSMLEPLIDYQARVARIDSVLHPDGFKIHINEISYTRYDPLCRQRNMSSGQLVGSYCREMYNIIQARRPGAPVRIYGDAFDTFTVDPRANQVTPGVPWNTGALEELPPEIEIMSMYEYSTAIDSTIALFTRHGNPTVVAVQLWMPLDGWLKGALAARKAASCNGYMYYVWQGDCDADIEWRTQVVGDLAWNLGPFIVHQPPAVTARPDSVVIRAEMWTDSFRVNLPVSLTATTLRYRLLPGGSWTTVTMTPDGTEMYRAVIHGITQATTAVEYYLTTTDHRAQTRTAPADAPQKVFVIALTTGGASTGGDGGEEIPHSLRRMSAATLVEWTADPSVAWYEVHVGDAPDFAAVSTTRLARQRPACTRLLLPSGRLTPDAVEALRVYAIREPKPGEESRAKSKHRK